MSAHLKNKTTGKAGFTLIELLVVVAIIAIIASLLLPALNKAKQQAQGVFDLNNIKQGQIAWHMYSGDCNDFLPGNWWQGEQAHANANGLAINWVSGWEQLGVPNTIDNTNTVNILSPAYAQLGPYLKNDKVFQCCASKALCQIGSGRFPLCRDVSMSVWMGYTNTIPSGNDAYKTFKKLSQVNGFSHATGATIGPSSAIVFLDEKDNSIDDGEFSIVMTTQASMANIPAFYHAGAGAVSFADSHAELHKWVSSVVLVPGQTGGTVVWGGSRPDNFKPITDGNTKDLVWLQQHATILAN